MRKPTAKGKETEISKLNMRTKSGNCKEEKPRMKKKTQKEM